MLHFVYETVVGAAFRALPGVALNARDVDAMQSFFSQKKCSAFVFAVTLSIVLFFFCGVLSWRTCSRPCFQEMCLCWRDMFGKCVKRLCLRNCLALHVSCVRCIQHCIST